jgi:hypothetical protein
LYRFAGAKLEKKEQKGAAYRKNSPYDLDK